MSIAAALAPACSSSSNPQPEAGKVDGSVGATCPAGDTISGAGGTLKTFTAPCADPGGGQFWVTASGESNAITGYPFPPIGNYPSDTWMVDGWQFTIEAYIVVVDRITLWSNPDVSATDQSRHGDEVAELDGPFVVDLHKGGPLAGQGGGAEQSTPIGVIANQNRVNGSPPFDSTATYAFGFSTVAAPASYAAYNVNLTADEAPYYALMAQNGYSVFYKGTATWNGAQTPFDQGVCSETNAGEAPDAGDDGGSGGTYAFTKLPQTLPFELGFSTPTNYVNCQNGNPQGGMAIGGEDNPRGIQSRANQSVVAQVTVHMDHPFWDSFAEDSPVHWDQIAARYLGVASPVAHVEDLQGVPYDGFTDHVGAPIPWRNCSGTYFNDPGNGQMFFDTLTVEQDPSGVCTPGSCTGIRDYYDFIRYTQSTQGHLNSQGLCYIDRQYPAPGGGS